MTQYNHALEFAFEVISTHPEGEDITTAMIVSAIEQRLHQLVKGGHVIEAVEVYDTYEVES